MTDVAETGGPDDDLFRATQRRQPELTPAQLRSRRRRSIAMGLAIGVLVVLFYAVTMVKMGSAVAPQP